MSALSKRHVLKEKEAKQLIFNISQKIPVNFEQFFGLKPRIELFKVPAVEIFLFNEKPVLAKAEGILFPTLIFIEVFKYLAKVVVDMGAVSHVCNGADILAPGVVLIQGSFRKDDFILVVDERYNKPLAVGLALNTSEDFKMIKKGKIVKNIHYVGDKIWKLIKSS